MVTPDATIAAIDGAIADATSPDAMRWVPPDKRDQPVLIVNGRVVDPVAFERAALAMDAAFKRFVETIANAAAAYGHVVATIRLRRTGPPPLAVDGAAYHRRQRARVRRRR